MLKAIIFDLNGLFVKTGEFLSNRLERDFAINREEFVPKLNEVLDKARQSGVEDSWPLWEKVLEHFKLKFTKHEWWDYWFRYEILEVPEMLELASKLKSRGLKIFVLSNNFKERGRYYQQNPAYEKLKSVTDKIYFSFETGLIKPNKQAYLKLLEENQLKPHECMFFDNTQVNVDAANYVGIKSYFFKNATDTLEKINNF